MRYTIKEKLPEAEYGAIREVEKFLIFPKIINNEIRWLETVRWKELFQCGKWYTIKWLDNER